MRIFLSILSLSLLGLAVCAQTPAAPSPAKAAAKKAPAKQVAPAVPKTPRPDGLYTTISTSVGDITLQLFEEQSPVTVKNFLGLATGRKAWLDPKTQKRVSRPLYNGLTFHRVIAGFMIQGGDPTGTGMGGTDVIADEFNPSLVIIKKVTFERWKDGKEAPVFAPAATKAGAAKKSASAAAKKTTAAPAK